LVGLDDRYHRRMPPIVIALTGGLGNQLFQFAASLALAESTGRGIQVCLRGYDRPASRRLFLQVRRWWRSIGADAARLHALEALVRRPELPGLTDLAETTREQDRRLGLDRRTLKRALGGSDLVGVETLHESDEVLEVVAGRRSIPSDRPILIAGFMQSDSIVAPQVESIRRRLRLPVETPHAARWVREVRAVPSVAVHVRRGDYTKKAFEKVFALLSPSWYAGAADLVATRESQATWFVFSDDPAWCREHLKLPGECRFIESESPVSPAEDLAIMAACRHHIVANSTFSWWGARLATGSGVVVAPTRWTLDSASPPDLLPASWRNLENPASRREITSP
jgi:hypothetical protein